MAGKNQHYVMRLLLNGFAYRVQGDERYVWCFRKGGAPFPANTRKVASEGMFYGESGNASLDDFITTELETKHSVCLDRIRKSGSLLSPVDIESLVEFVHFSLIRTKNLRDTMLTGVKDILEEMQSAFTDADDARRQLLKEQEQDSPMWNQALTAYVRAKYGVRNRVGEWLLKWWENKSFKRWLTDSSQARAHIQQQVELNKKTLSATVRQLDERVKTAHNSMLQDNLQSREYTALPRYKRYLELRWRVQRFESGSLILGDVAVLQFERRSGQFSAAFNIDVGDAILLPVSHDLLVIGSVEEAGPLPSLHEINCASAQFSMQFFVSFRNSESEKEYQQLLGSEVVRAPKILAS